MNLYLLIIKPNGTTERIPALPGMVHPPLNAGERLAIVDERGNPVTVAFLQKGTDLVIDLEGEKDAIVQNYFKAAGEGPAQIDPVSVNLGGDTAPARGSEEAIATGAAAMPKSDFTLMYYSKTRYIDFDQPAGTVPPSNIMGGGVPGVGSAAPRDLSPLANPDEGTTREKDALVIDLLKNDYDPEGGALSLVSIADQPVSPGSVIGLPSGSSVRVDAGGAIAYLPGSAYASLAEGETAIDTFVYKVTDPAGNQSFATVTITIVGQNDPPQGENDVYSTFEEEGIIIDPLVNDFDVDAGDSISIRGIQVAGHFVVPQVGVLLKLDSGAALMPLPDGTFQYYPPTGASSLGEGETLLDHFVYQITDRNGATDTATVTITVRGQDDATVARPDFAITSEDAPVTIAVLNNDHDPDASDNPLTVTHLTQPAKGFVTTDGTTVTFHPGADFQYLAAGESTLVTFTYDATTPSGNRVTETVTVTVTGVNDPPQAVHDTAHTTQNAPVTVAVLANDTDPDGADSLFITGVTQPSLGTVSFNASSVVFDPGTSFNDLKSGETATATFTYQISDGKGGTDTATVTVTVNGQDDPTITRPDFAITTEDAPVTIAVLNNDSDADASDNPLTVTHLTQPAKGSVTTNGTTVTFHPGADFQYLAAGESTQVTFTYDATTPSGNRVTETVTVTVTGVNDPPQAVHDTAHTTQNAPVTVAVLANDTDPDGADSLFITGVTQPSLGTVSFNASSVVFDPGTSFNDLKSGETATATFTYQISDGKGGTDTATVTVTVNGQDDPTITQPDFAITTEDAPVTIAVLNNDSDPDASDNPLTVTHLTQPAKGSVTTNGTTVTFHPGADFQYLAAGESTQVTFTYDATTPAGARVTETVTVTVTGRNDPSITRPDAATTTEDASVLINVLANDSDPDAADNPLTVTNLTQPARGRVTTDGLTVIFDPGNDFQHLGTGQTDVVTFTYDATTPGGDRVTETVTVTVTGINDVPVAEWDFQVNNTRISPVTFNAAANDRDPENFLNLASIDLDPSTPGRQTSFTVAGQGTWTADDSGNITFTPVPGLSAQPSPIAYTISDQEGLVSNVAKLVVDYYVGDIWFGNDESGSVNATEFSQGRQLISQIAAQFSFGSGQVGLNAGLYAWASTTTQGVQIPFSGNANFVNQAISQPRSFSGGTDIGQGILYGVNLMLTTGRPGVEKTLVILTDATSAQIHGDASLLDDAAAAKAAGIKLVIVAIDEATLDPTALAKLALAASTNVHGQPLLISAPTYADISAQTVIDTVGSIVAARLASYDPVTTADLATVLPDTPTEIRVLDNDRDANGRPLTIQSVTQGAHGSVTINANGTVTYTPNPSYVGSDSFSYTVNNGSGGLSTALVTVNVAAAVPPIVIDRDGDGAEFRSSQHGIFMDLDGNGTLEKLAWAHPDDAVLIFDANDNGKVDGRAEFAFADYSANPNATDLQGLAEAFDTNQDGILSAADQTWQQFRLWQDANGNGIVDEGEMISLDDAGIESIGLVSDGVRHVTADGDVVVHGQSLVTYRDGATGTAADASFVYHEQSHGEEEMLSLLGQKSPGPAVAVGSELAGFSMAELIDDDLHQEIGEIVTAGGQVVNMSEAPAAFMPSDNFLELTAAPPLPAAVGDEDLAAAAGK